MISEKTLHDLEYRIIDALFEGCDPQFIHALVDHKVEVVAEMRRAIFPAKKEPPEDIKP